MIKILLFLSVDLNKEAIRMLTALSSLGSSKTLLDAAGVYESGTSMMFNINLTLPALPHKGDSLYLFEEKITISDSGFVADEPESNHDAVLEVDWTDCPTKSFISLFFSCMGQDPKYVEPHCSNTGGNVELIKALKALVGAGSTFSQLLVVLNRRK